MNAPVPSNKFECGNCLGDKIIVGYWYDKEVDTFVGKFQCKSCDSVTYEPLEAELIRSLFYHVID